MSSQTTNRRAIGQLGSWFVTVGTEKIPCVHAYWWKNKSSYFDPGIKPGDNDEFVNALKRMKRVVLSNDRLMENGTFKRKHAHAIFCIENISVDEDGLRFDFKKRLEDLPK